jgi:hypothetical protein
MFLVHGKNATAPKQVRRIFFCGTNGTRQRLSDGGGRFETGLLLFGVSMKTTDDFFKKEAQRCRDNAKMATRSDDRQFWLNSANRWETMQRVRKEPSAEVVAVEHPYMRNRSRAA